MWRTPQQRLLTAVAYIGLFWLFVVLATHFSLPTAQ